jgi:phosphotransferase system  glucose/maltose/N-acetylglucosamine-specific IIC component
MLSPKWILYSCILIIMIWTSFYIRKEKQEWRRAYFFLFIPIVIVLKIIFLFFLSFFFLHVNNKYGRTTHTYTSVSVKVHRGIYYDDENLINKTTMNNTTTEIFQNNSNNALYISYIVWRSCGLLCALFGIPGHCFHILITLKKSNRKQTTSLHFTVISICELTFLLGLYKFLFI